MWVLALVGLAAIGASIWFVSTQSRPSGSRPPLRPALSPRARATQEAQLGRLESYRTANDRLRAEVLALQQDLERTQGELAHAQRQAALSEQEWSVVLDKAPLALILDAPQLTQQRSLSCEASAAAMAAQYFGLAVSESDIQAALPLHENPHLGFRGNVDGPHGGLVDYGVYAAPIAKVLSDLGLQVEPFEGDIRAIKAHIRQGRPVLAWITYGLQVQTPQQWSLVGPAGPAEQVTLVPYEHAILIVGYNREGLWVHDPFEGTRDFYSESEFWRAFGYLDYMALVVGPPAR
jgi:uncharacterized protein YvpB